MALNHLNLTVPDVAVTSMFFERFFGFKRIASRGSTLVVVVDEAGFTLVLNQFKKAVAFSYPDDFVHASAADSGGHVQTALSNALRASRPARPSATWRV
jgi:hypothetical protein